jgi:formate hydrogenlyase subunit 6/NADH:ubiquinone oxidoreductase subunit I
MLKEVWSGSIEILRAMWITLKHLFRRPVTNQFPSEPVAVLQGTPRAQAL